MAGSPSDLLRLALALLALAPSAAPAMPAAGPLRIATLVEVTVDGAPADSARARGAFDKALAAAGLVQVEAAAAGVQSAADAERGRGFPAADMVVLVRIDSRKLAANIEGTQLARYEAAAELRALATETGDVFGVLTAEGPGIDVDAASAARIAAAQAGDALAKAFVDRLDVLVSAPSTLDVMIDGLTDNAETHHVAQALGAWPEVAGVTIVESFIQGPTPRSTIRLTVQKLAASTLAARIEAARGLGLRVESHTLRRVFARFDPALRVQLALRVERLKNGTGEKAEDAMLAPLTKVLATALGGLPAVVVADSAAPFTVRGTLRYVGAADAAIELSLQTPDGAVLAETRLVGPGAHFSRTVRKAAADLQAQGLAKVLGDKNLRILAGIPLALPMPTAVASRIERFEPQPATVGAPMQIEVVLRSLDAPLDDALLEVRDAAGTLWASQRVPQVPADMPLTIPLAGPSAATPGAIEVTATLRARRDGRWLTEHRSAVVVVRPEAIARWSGAPP